MSGFANQIIGGLSKLVRPSVQSPNYAQGVSGWTIDKDGSAEFNNVTIRGNFVIATTANGSLFVYAGAPALGKLLFSIASQNGTDPYGNGYAAGVQAHNTGSSYDGILFKSATNPGASGTWDGTIGMDAGGTNLVLQNAHGFGSLLLNNSGRIAIKPDSGEHIYLETDYAGGAGLAIGSGPVGRYYYNRTLIPASQSLTNDQLTVLTNLNQSNLISDYPETGGLDNAWNYASGVWTCPWTGQADIDFGVLIGSWVAGSYLYLGVEQNGGLIANVDSASRFGTDQLNFIADVTAGDQLTFLVRQNTGAAKSPVANARSHIVISRRL